MSKVRSFFERLTGSIPVDEDVETQQATAFADTKTPVAHTAQSFKDPIQEEEAELNVDMYQTADEIVVQTMVAGVRPEDLDISITQDMVTISGKRVFPQHVSEDHYFYRELYWGKFNRSILLPQEIDAEAAQATMKHGLLHIRLPKLDKTRVQKVRVRTE